MGINGERERQGDKVGGRGVLMEALRVSARRK